MTKQKNKTDIYKEIRKKKPLSNKKNKETQIY